MRKRNCWLQIVALLLCGILLTACDSTTTSQYSEPDTNDYENQTVYECELELSERTVISTATVGSTYYCTAVDKLTNVQYLMMASSSPDGGKSIISLIDSSGSHLLAN